MSTNLVGSIPTCRTMLQDDYMICEECQYPSSELDVYVMGYDFLAWLCILCAIKLGRVGTPDGYGGIVL